MNEVLRYKYTNYPDLFVDVKIQGEVLEGVSENDDDIGSEECILEKLSFKRSSIFVSYELGSGELSESFPEVV